MATEPVTIAGTFVVVAARAFSGVKASLSLRSRGAAR